ncbi:MAG: ribosomal-processing cysteine protease Prp [Firmicutes bacterium]|nr:ribosomal-processing cysteine protease Prp [Bacillota bacterium]
MTSIVITRDKNKKIVSISCDGHCDYGEMGEDIVCASLSSLVQTAVLGLMSVAQLPVEYKVDHENALLTLNLPKDISEKERNNADMILETMYLGIADLQSEYGKFIKLKINKE